MIKKFKYYQMIYVDESDCEEENIKAMSIKLLVDLAFIGSISIITLTKAID